MNLPFCSSLSRPRRLYNYRSDLSGDGLDPDKDFITVPNIPLWTALSRVKLEAHFLRFFGLNSISLSHRSPKDPRRICAPRSLKLRVAWEHHSSMFPSPDSCGATKMSSIVSSLTCQGARFNLILIVFFMSWLEIPYTKKIFLFG